MIMLWRLMTAGLLILFLGFSALAVAEKAQQEEPVTVRITSGEFPPYLSENLKYGGIGLRIIEEAFALEGVAIEVGYYPWKRAYALVRDGQWQASATWSYNDVRNEQMFYSDPLYHSPYVFFHRKSDSLNWQSLDDLASFKIGASSGYAYTEAFWKYAGSNKLTVQTAETDEQNFRKLIRGRIDLFPINVDVGVYLLNKHFSDKDRNKITYHPRRFTNPTTHLVFSRKVPSNATLVKRFNKGLAQLKASGVIDQYLEAYRMGRSSY